MVYAMHRLLVVTEWKAKASRPARFFVRIRINNRYINKAWSRSERLLSLLFPQKIKDLQKMQQSEQQMLVVS